MRGLSIVACFFLLAGCREPLPQDILSKMDVMLRNEVQEKRREEILFSGRWNGAIDDAVKTELESSGVVLQTVAKEFFTARGRAASIVKLARIEGVVRLESGKKVRSLEKTERGSA